MAAPGPHAHAYAYHRSLERSSFPDASALPPTPPDEDAQVPLRVETPAMEAPRRQLATPPPVKSAKRPLTPDYTPPSMGLKVPRPPLAHHHSSAAESFRTAREEQSRELLNGFGGEEEAQRDGEHEDLREDGANGTPDLRTEGSAQTLRTAFSRRAESEVNGSRSAFAPSPRIEVPEEEPWKEMPGAFRGTPSTTSSRNQSSRPKQYLHSPSTPSTGSSPRFPKFKRFPDSEPASEASSRDVARVKNYEEEPESPLMQSPSQRREQMDGDDWEKHVSYVHSDDEWEERREDEEEDEESQRDGANEEGKVKRRPNGHREDNWEKHVSYIASDDEEEVPKKNHAAGKVLEEARRNLGLPSPRLRGNGRQIERGGEQRASGLGIHADPVKPAESRDDSPSQSRRHALHRTGHLQEVDASPPNVTIRKRVKHAIPPEEDFGGGRKEREARKLSWLREQAETLASHDIPAEFIATPPRDSNDLVYKHIQKANMDKYDAIKAGRAVEARVIPTDEARSRHALRHVSKKHSLRSLSESNDGSPTAMKRNQSSRHKGAFDPRRERREDSRRHDGGRSVSSPISQHHSLRHEKRPLSGFGRPMQSSNAPTSLNGSETSPKLVQESSGRQKPVPKLRHASLPVHFSKEANQPNGVPSSDLDERRGYGHGLRRAPKEHRLEKEIPSLRQTYEQDENSPPADMMSPSSSHFLGLGQHQRNRSLATPMSASAWSDRTDMEVCEAKNVTIFPHSNESVLVVQHGTKAANRDDADEASDAAYAIEDGSVDGDQLQVPPLFTTNLAQTPAPPAIAVNGKSIHTVDSPLTNPRDPPMPPVIKFIPPTPNEEDDRELGLDGTADDGSIQRRPSLARRARRYSDIVVRPLLGRNLAQRSHTIRPSPSMHEKRDERLHPNWVPNSFWQDDDDEDEDDFGDPEDEPFMPLPAGGDTSEYPKQKFPRKMSVRMPGFRGTGGFLLGNSVGVDRHGTNNRRHHVTLRRGGLDTQSAGRSPRHVSSADSLHRFMAPRRSFAIPGTKTRVQFMGFKAVKERLHKFRAARNEAEKERRRAELREQIGVRIVHGEGH